MAWQITPSDRCSNYREKVAYGQAFSQFFVANITIWVNIWSIYYILITIMGKYVVKPK